MFRDHKLKLIGLVGHSGGGKSATAAILEEQGYKRLSMAKPLKDGLLAMGLSHDDLYGCPQHRSAPSAMLCGKSPRHAMVTLGTEWGREMIGDDFWVNLMQERIIAETAQFATGRSKCADGACKGIVIEDVRFPNEVAMIENLGGQIWRVRRPEVERTPGIIETMAFSRRPITAAIGRIVMAIATRCNAKLVHESEYHWRGFNTDIEFWNTGTLADLRRQVTTMLARIT